MKYSLLLPLFFLILFAGRIPATEIMFFSIQIDQDVNYYTFSDDGLKEKNGEGFSGGDGSVENPYLISTPALLSNIRNYTGTDYADIYFQQIDDIDLNIPPYNDGKEW
ncbi:MAG: hypothetical protein JJU13_01285 [Balneolaceae bacterium]|nr:hypothetical protein [Balneolaceae bacterium]